MFNPKIPTNPLPPSVIAHRAHLAASETASSAEPTGYCGHPHGAPAPIAEPRHPIAPYVAGGIGVVGAIGVVGTVAIGLLLAFAVASLSLAAVALVLRVLLADSQHAVKDLRDHR